MSTGDMLKQSNDAARKAGCLAKWRETYQKARETLGVRSSVEAADRACGLDFKVKRISGPIVEALRGLTDEQRAEVLDALHSKYCQYCGREQDLDYPLHYCQCTNDD